MIRYKVTYTAISAESGEIEVTSTSEEFAKVDAEVIAYQRHPNAQEIRIDEVRVVAAQKDPLAIALAALRDIAGINASSGRWLTCEDTPEAVGYNPFVWPDGCYPNDDPPDGYDADGWAGSEVDTPEDPLTPVYWEPFSAGEQTEQLESIKAKVEAALATIDNAASVDPAP